MLGSATGATYEAAIPPLLADPAIDALIVLFVPPVVAGADEVAAAIAASRGAPAPTSRCSPSLITADGTPGGARDGATAVATFAYPESAARALGLAADARGVAPAARPATSPSSTGSTATRRARIVRDVLAASDEAWLDAAADPRLLAAYGIPLVAGARRRTAAEAVEAARELGFPAVVKTAVPGAHKTDSGGIALDLARRGRRCAPPPSGSARPCSSSR